MVGITFAPWLVGALALAVIVVLILVRQARKGPRDPEASLRELIGPQGIAARDRNRAAASAKGKAQLLELAEDSARKLRIQGDIAGAEKMEEYAATLRARRD